MIRPPNALWRRVSPWPSSACGPDAPADTTLAASAAPPTTGRLGGRARPTAGPYRFDRPAARFKLPEALREISALTVLDGESLGAVQDEEGDLYILSMETGRVTAVVPFGPPGDYEGIELAGDRLFVLRADGAILELDGWDSGEAARPDVRDRPRRQGVRRRRPRLRRRLASACSSRARRKAKDRSTAGTPSMPST